MPKRKPQPKRPPWFNLLREEMRAEIERHLAPLKAEVQELASRADVLTRMERMRVLANLTRPDIGDQLEEDLEGLIMQTMKDRKIKPPTKTHSATGFISDGAQLPTVPKPTEDE